MSRKTRLAAKHRLCTCIVCVGDWENECAICAHPWPCSDAATPSP